MKLTILIFTLLSSVALAQTTTFPNCAKDDVRQPLDNFCPRVEGVHFQNCCPPLEKKNSLQCYYYVYKPQGQPVYVNSSYTTCVGADADGYGGNEVVTNCCALAQEACYDNEVLKNVTQRLINHGGGCCFEPCPPANYWTSPPPDGQITTGHALSPDKRTTGVCTPPPINRCAYGSSPNCAASSRCQQKPSPPGPPSMPGTPSNPLPGTPKPPNQSPGPSTPSQPAQNPPAAKPPAQAPKD